MSAWRSDLPPPRQLVLGVWRGQHIICEWSEDHGSRTWWVGGDYHEGLTEDDGPSYWMPLPEPLT